jgi:hypothetical protein
VAKLAAWFKKRNIPPFKMNYSPTRFRAIDLLAFIYSNTAQPSFTESKSGISINTIAHLKLNMIV